MLGIIATNKITGNTTKRTATPKQPLRDSRGKLLVRVFGCANPPVEVEFLLEETTGG
ncbi:hypothetical protein [Sulfuriferula thiophila]|uniref:hypothetical protein n=1 Tax=Sulfuriferula thiophila TaxID=1781211 RepID=UPI00167482B0|nr:hypothetical protein [Sulfuriferula thiophila]